MGDINILSRQVSELIAAGEVIERPGSVIKELIENSIDAGATAVTVEIKNGGVTFMRVTDNGKGIRREDVKNAFLRHATSKIAEQTDLDSIATLGFRGEALASICAVSRTEVMTKHYEESEGTRYCIDGGYESGFEPVGCPQGTTFIVRDLFYNVPARMKFLKKDVAEANNISNLMDRIALSHPEIGFTFIRDGKQVMKTSGNGKLSDAIYQVFGKQFYSSLIPVSYEYNGISVSGYITNPINSDRSNRNMQLFYVNGRYVKTKTAAAALEQAYKGSIMGGKFPACVIEIKMNCSNLDVNVHPAKLEIRFTSEKPVYDCVYYAVKSAISNYDTRNIQSSGTNLSGDPRLLAPVADRGSQLGFNYTNALISQLPDEPDLLYPQLSNVFGAKEDNKRSSFSSSEIVRDNSSENLPSLLTHLSSDNDKTQGFIDHVIENQDHSFTENVKDNSYEAQKLASIKELENADDSAGESDDSDITSENTNGKISKKESDLFNPSEISENDNTYETISENLDASITDGIVSEKHDASIPETSDIGYKTFEGYMSDSSETLKSGHREDYLILHDEKNSVSAKYIGEAFSAYIIIQYDEDRIMFIDKHAAHERLIYENLKKQNDTSYSQILLEPVSVTMDKSDAQSVLESKEMLSEAGFEIEEFGSGTILIRAVPVIMENLAITEQFFEIAEYLKTHRRVQLTEKMEWIYQNTACRAAIKAGNHNKPEELINLAVMLENNPDVRYCPHGRPIYFFMSKQELEKKFMRI